MEAIGILSTLLMKMKFSIFGLSYGRKCKFYGQTFIYKQKKSDIIIGNSNTFRSYPNSNLIGINRNCSLSTLQPKAKLIIGNNCGFSGAVIAAFDNITIKDNLKCGANVLITDSDWHSEDSRSGKPKPILIEQNVWIGEGAKILKGVTLGENCIIGAGSVVTQSIPANTVAAGNPAKVVKNINQS